MSDRDPTEEAEATRERHHERTERVEELVREEMTDADTKYPVRTEELAVEYAETEVELPNETENLGDVFDRLVDEEFDTRAEAREAALHELTGEADGPQEANADRNLEQLREVEEGEK